MSRIRYDIIHALFVIDSRILTSGDFLALTSFHS